MNGNNHLDPAGTTSPPEILHSGTVETAPWGNELRNYIHSDFEQLEAIHNPDGDRINQAVRRDGYGDLPVMHEYWSPGGH